MPGSSSTNAPKSISRVTLPGTVSPRSKSSSTRSQGLGMSCFRPRLTFWVVAVDLEDLDLDLLADLDERRRRP